MEDDGAAVWDIVVEEVIAGRLPMDPGERCRGLCVTPARGFRTDHAIDDLSPCLDPSDQRIRREGAFSKAVHLNAIRPSHAILGICPKVVMDEHGVAVSKLVSIGGFEGACSVLIEVEERVFEVVRKKDEPAFAGTVADRGPVIGVIVPEEGGGASVEVTCPEREEHVVYEIVDIEQSGGITGGDSVRLQTLECEIGCV